MLLDSLNPSQLPALCAQLSAEIVQLEREIAQYRQVLAKELQPEQRATLSALHERRSRRARMLQERLAALCEANYQDDSREVLRRTLQVA